MKKVLVTGGCGFIGSHVVDSLILKGYEVAIIDNLSLGKYYWDSNEKKPRLFKTDILDLKACLDIFEEVRPDVVIHLAANHYIPFCEKNIFQAYELNVRGTLNIIECSRTVQVKRFFFASTGDVYAPSFQRHREVDMISPIYVYGHTKYLGEQICMKYHESAFEDCGMIIGRLFNAAGPRETNPHLLPEVVRQIIDGKRVIEVGNTWPLRDFIDVKSMAEIIADLSLNAGGIDLVNIGSGQAVTVSHALQTLVSVLPFKVEIVSVPEKQRPNDRPYLCPDINKLKRIIGKAAESFSEQTAESIFAPYRLTDKQA
ncbi:MAG: NAD-dependent epimerase/dehydratase family protein [Nitrospirota bacterium]|nr:NAD-dependent epimerase/dehydratase family protein [Nitrospirota bacterium]